MEKPTIIIGVPAYSPHDAVGNEVLAQYEWAKSAGFDSYIYTKHAGAELGLARLDESSLLKKLENPTTIFIWHYPCGWVGLEDLLKEAKAKLVLRFHNLTPPPFFSRYDEEATRVTQEGVEQLRTLVKMPLFSSIWANSDFSKKDLETLGLSHRKIKVISPFIRVSESAGESQIPKTPADETQILFVGRLAPNKGHEHLIKTFFLYKKTYNPNSKLTLVGNIPKPFHAYHNALKGLIRSLKLGNAVSFKEGVSDLELSREYQKSALFGVMSEHEGFCIPIIEAQSRGLPVVALGSTAIPDTLGSGQLCYEELDYDFFAAAWDRVIRDQVLRETLIKNGRMNAEQYSVERSLKRLSEAINSLGN